MNKQRWAQLCGLEVEQPLLMLEGNQPLYKEELSEMIREEIKKAIEDSQIEKDMSNLNIAKQTKSLATSMGFAGIGFANSNNTTTNAFSNGPGRTLGFGGPGFM